MTITNVTCDSLEGLQILVNSYLADGWKINGGILHTLNGETIVFGRGKTLTYTYYQQLIKYSSSDQSISLKTLSTINDDFHAQCKNRSAASDYPCLSCPYNSNGKDNCFIKYTGLRAAALKYNKI